MSFAFNIPFKVERKPAWVNPYVTDGLVAMWDGEWNAGGGVHDSSATAWKNLVEESICGDIIFNADCSFGDNYAQYSSSDYGYGQSAQFAAPVIGSWEMVAYREGKGEVGLFLDNLNIGATNVYVGLMSGYERSASYSIDTSNKLTSCSYDGVNAIIYKNAVNRYSVARSKAAITNNRIRFGRYYGTVYGQVRVNTFRLYNRVLSATEIAANYAVDKARFNI